MNRNLLLQNIETSASYVLSVDPCRFEAGLITKEAAEAIRSRCDTCLADIARAFREGLELSELRAQCLEMRALANDHLYLCRIRQALLQANVWISDLQTPESLSGEQKMAAAETGRALLQVLQDAHEAGVSDRMRVKMNGAPVTLAEVKAFGEFVAAVSALDIEPKGIE